MTKIVATKSVAKITKEGNIKCLGASEYQKVRDTVPGEQFYPLKMGYFCDSCDNYDSTEYGYEIDTYVNGLKLTSYAYCCSKCHGQNCPCCNP